MSAAANGADGSSRAAALRLAFDRGFAEARETAEVPCDDLLAVDVGGAPHLLRLADIASLHVDHPLVAVPSPDPRLLGIAGVRNTLAPVFDLRLLLGYPATAPARWLATARGPTPVALAFDRFDGHARVPRAEVAAAVADSAADRVVSGAVLVRGVVRPLIQMAAVLQLLARKTRPGAPVKER
ncbi:MAG TPA: chemotaxis protein CheW [Polyangia bacterium]|nr:chemotaxis protein CheW [Polyangia bacterium]